MKRFYFILLLLISSSGWSQIFVQMISNDTIPLWQTDKFFVYDYLIKNTNHDAFVSIVDSTENCDSITVKYSLNQEFIQDKAKLSIGVSNLKVWVRANKPFQSFPLAFSLMSDSVFFTDTLMIKMKSLSGEYLFQQQIIDWVDFNSDRYEKIEMQLYDSLWNLVATIDTNSDRIMVRNLEYGSYFLKTGSKVIAFKKINPQSFFEEPILHHSTNQ